jgi:rifampicin phosphotransferase
MGSYVLGFQEIDQTQIAMVGSTAGPITGNHKVAVVEASFGFGEALVSGLVNADIYKVRDGEMVRRTIGAKQLAIHASVAGGTREQAIEPARQQQPALTEREVVRLAQLGRRIEAHFGRPHAAVVSFLQQVKDENFLDGSRLRRSPSGKARCS